MGVKKPTKPKKGRTTKPTSKPKPGQRGLGLQKLATVMGGSRYGGPNPR